MKRNATLKSKTLSALEFASRAHGEQLRKNPLNTPYISHPYAVGLILSKAGFSEDVVIAGFLHDVLEDTKITAEELGNNFGKNILQLVLGVTENKKLVWDERKQAYNDHLATQSADVVGISAADLLANRQSLLLILHKGENSWIYFSKNPKEYYEKLMKYDAQRIKIIEAILKNHPLLIELKQVEQEVKELSEKLKW